jgi:hypothetical protein
MDFKAAFPSIAKERLASLMKVRQMDGDHILQIKRIVSERTMVVIIERNTMARRLVDAGVV